MGYPSLFEFAVKELKYSEGAAGRRIAAMRMMCQVPEIQERIRDGSLNVTVVSMAKRATEGKTTVEKIGIVEKLIDQSQRQAERTLAELVPEFCRPDEKIRAVANDSVQITFVADAALVEKFEKINSLLSHKNPNPTYGELFHLMADRLLMKIDLEKQTSSVTPAPESHASTTSRYVPIRVKREIWRKYLGKCSFVDSATGRACGSRHLLQVDHRVPLALGGRTEMPNLRLLYRAHNL